MFSESEEMDDETTNLLILFVGIMFGVNGAETVIAKISKTTARKVGKGLAQKLSTKGVVYPIVKKIAQLLGIRMTKEIFAEAVAKIIPILGGLICGTLTFFTYKPMVKKLKKYLASLPCADVGYYRDVPYVVETIDVEFDEGLTEKIIANIENEISSEEMECTELEKRFKSIDF